MAYAYRDKYGILHATQDKKTAEEFASSRIIEYEGHCLGGYPAVLVEIIDYGGGRTYINGNEKNGVELDKMPGGIAGEIHKLLSTIGI
jgi:hypothetical protein